MLQDTLISLGVTLLVFLALRWIVLWYFKIHRAVKALEDIAVSLRTLPSVQKYDCENARKPPKAA